MRALIVLSLVVVTGCGASAPPALDAEAFIKQVEKERLRLLIQRERADWVRSTHITHDTEAIQAETESAIMKFSAETAKAAQQYAGDNVSPVVARKLKMLRTSQSLPAPSDAAKREALAKLSGAMQSRYGKGRYCPPDAGGDASKCLSLGALSRRLAESRDPAVLLDAWQGWRTISRPMRAEYTEYVALANTGATEMGFADLGELWKSKYDMAPDAFAADIDRLWNQVKPLYEQLHCYTRAKLSEKYTTAVAPATGPIPAHLLGNMWAQDWSYLGWLLLPGKGAGESEVTTALAEKKIDERGMVKIAERFFESLGLGPLPKTFWERSMFTRPKDREVECHASAWPVDWRDDLRIKMCIEITEEDFTTIHHELRHLYYYAAYKDQDTLFTDSANDGFHEALGDVIALSVTPSYLKQIDLVANPSTDEIQVLLRRALERVAFLPFGIVIDKWRWQVFSGEIATDAYNEGWWKLKQQYQGVKPPVARTEQDFDPGAKYHVAGSVPYTRYFIAHILQFQFHRALCKASGHKGPLHTCSIYGSKEAGKRLAAMMALGSSRPWPEALKLATGETQMDASALVDYFAPLMVWLKEQNAGRQCGW